jgi:hypothetical protein
MRESTFQVPADSQAGRKATMSEEARPRIRSKPGFFESLSPEARSAIAMYDGPEAMGPPRRKE